MSVSPATDGILFFFIAVNGKKEEIDNGKQVKHISGGSTDRGAYA